jgi:hypothetical protein
VNVVKVESTKVVPIPTSVTKDYSKVEKRVFVPQKVEPFAFTKPVVSEE